MAARASSFFDQRINFATEDKKTKSLPVFAGIVLQLGDFKFSHIDLNIKTSIIYRYDNGGPKMR